MDIICVIGLTPGDVSVTVTHHGVVRQLPMEVARHGAGGWQARHRNGAWGPRCHSVNTALLLEAADAFSDGDAKLAAD